MRLKMILWVVTILLVSLPIAAQSKRKVIIDQDARGPATTDQQSMIVLLQSPLVQTLGITIVSGDQWRDEEVAHTLRMLEIIGRTDVPVYPGAVFPLINRQETIERWESLYGKVAYKGAWNRKATGDGVRGTFHGPYEIPDIVEGNPTTKPADEDAAHFIIRMVHKYPHEVTIYAGGPLTNLAQALSIDPKVADLAQELVIMGGSIAPVVPMEWQTENRREFNFWWDPEAVHVVLTSSWHKITITTVDISVKTRLTRAMIAEIAKSPSPVATVHWQVCGRRVLVGRVSRGSLARSQHHHQRDLALHGHRHLAHCRLRKRAGLGTWLTARAGRTTGSRPG